MQNSIRSPRGKWRQIRTYVFQSF